MLLGIISVLAIVTPLLPIAQANTEFVKPAAGEVVTGTSLAAAWKESGIKPLISTFSSYQLFLCAGGNNASNFEPLFQLQTYATFSDGNEWSGAISTGWGGNSTNAYFLKMICTSACGPLVVEYSPRFTLSSMTGSFPPNILEGLATIGSSTAGPASDNDDIPAAAASCTSSIALPSTTTSGLQTASTVPGTPATTASGYASSTSLLFGSPKTSLPASVGSTAGWSSGTLAGVIVGAIVAFAAIAAVVFFLLIKLRKRRHSTDELKPPTSSFRLFSMEKSPMRRLYSHSSNHVAELSAHTVHKEMEADKSYPREVAGTPVSELPTRHSIYEMPAS